MFVYYSLFSYANLCAFTVQMKPLIKMSDSPDLNQL